MAPNFPSSRSSYRFQLAILSSESGSSLITFLITLTPPSAGCMPQREKRQFRCRSPCWSNMRKTCRFVGFVTDEKLLEQLKENPYLQFFIGLESFQHEVPFDPSPPDIRSSGGESDSPSPSSTADDIFNQRTSRVDATCVPADLFAQ